MAILQGMGYGSHTIKKEVKILEKIINNPKLIIDIGTNVCNYTSEIFKLYPVAEVFYLTSNNKFGYIKIKICKRKIFFKSLVK